MRERLEKGADETPKLAYVTSQLQDAEGPIVAVSDYMKAVPDQIARFGRIYPMNARPIQAFHDRDIMGTR